MDAGIACFSHGVLGHHIQREPDQRGDVDLPTRLQRHRRGGAPDLAAHVSHAPGSIDHAAAAADHAVSHFRASNLHSTYAKKERKSVEVQQRELLALNTPLRLTALDPRLEPRFSAAPLPPAI